MREIKFRAWDTPNKYMITHKELCLVPLTYDEVFKGKEDYPLMQYAGLKDKNGVEIYESDVVYLAGYGNYVAEFPFIELYDIDDPSDIGEILGNIHEKPELDV